MKSNVSDYMELLQHVYDDACNKCIADVSNFRDLRYIRSRVEEEGLSFLTITLPQFARDFERSLANGCIDSKSFRSFRKNRAIPAFLAGMLSLVFDRETGELSNESLKRANSNDSDSVVNDTSTIVESVRQICRLFAKVEIPCAPSRVRAALRNYVVTEREIAEFSAPEEAIAAFRSVSLVLWGDMARDFDYEQVKPRHGPGATAERISGNGKYRLGRWHERLESYFPLLGTALPLGAYASEELQKGTLIPVQEEQPVRVVTVPKTLKSPRIIAIEPVCMQFVQQGIRSYLYDKIESSPISAGHVNFRDQSVNQGLAMSSSATGRLATLDLSDASDRVPWSVAQLMFQWDRDLLDCIAACRSLNAQMPDGEVLPLRKFASMGSALCFPVEAMYFYTICVMALLDCKGLSYTFRNALEVSRDVYVYGDDILVPSTNAIVVQEYLQKYNCKVNVHKSFWTGKFRESCGMDAYDGYDVTPTYVTQPRPLNKRSPEAIVSWVALSRQFYLKGYWRSSEHVNNVLEKVMGVELPYTDDDCSGLGRKSFLHTSSIGRWNGRYHRYEVRAMVARPVFYTDILEGYGALGKALLIDKVLGDEVSEDPAHLERSALHGTVTLKRRWVPATF